MEPEVTSVLINIENCDRTHFLNIHTSRVQTNPALCHRRQHVTKILSLLLCFFFMILPDDNCKDLYPGATIINYM